MARTDGASIVQLIRPSCCEQGPFQVVLLDPAGNVVLASGPGSSVGEFLLNAGWIAFTRADIGGVAQAWVRSPAGAETQLSFFGTFSDPRLLKDDGELLFMTRNATSDLYRASPTSAAVKIAGGEAEPVYIDGVAHVMVGASLFRVN